MIATTYETKSYVWLTTGQDESEAEEKFCNNPTTHEAERLAAEFVERRCQYTDSLPGEAGREVSVRFGARDALRFTVTLEVTHSFRAIATESATTAAGAE